MGYNPRHEILVHCPNCVEDFAVPKSMKEGHANCPGCRQAVPVAEDRVASRPASTRNDDSILPFLYGRQPQRVLDPCAGVAFVLQHLVVETDDQVMSIISRACLNTEHHPYGLALLMGRHDVVADSQPDRLR